MLSFTALTTLATLAFAAFSSAVPVGPLGDIGLSNIDSTPAVANALGSGQGLPNIPVGGGVVTRDDAPAVPKSLVVIFGEFNQNMQPHVDLIHTLTAETASVETVQPILVAIQVTIHRAVEDVAVLVGHPVEVILASATGTVLITVAQVAQLLGNILILVVSVLAQLIQLVGDDLKILQPLLAAIGVLLANLVAGVLAIVPTLLADLQPIVANLVPTLRLLVWRTLLGVLQLL